MKQNLTSRQQEIYDAFLEELKKQIDPAKHQELVDGLNNLDLPKIVSTIDSINFAAPEARKNIVGVFYYDRSNGFRELLRQVVPGREQRTQILDSIAGFEDARSRGKEQE